MKKFYIYLFIIFVLCSCTNKSSKQNDVNDYLDSDLIDEENEKVTYEPTIITTKLVMAGDALTHESVYLDNKTDNGYDFTYPLENVKNIVKDYTLAYYNQETVLGGSNYPITGYPIFNTPQEVGDALIDAGFNLVSLATNHLLDYYNVYGKELICSQRNYFLKYFNVIASGSYLSNEDKDKVVIGEKNGLTYALLSYTAYSNTPGPLADESYLINYIDKETIENDVKKYRDNVDLLIVAMHWGEEGSLEENDYQREYAKFLADLDVDIVIGTHPHVLQPIEWIDDTLVFYSLGNLYSNQYFNIDNLSSVLASVDVVKTYNEEGSSITIQNITCDMIFTDLYDKHKVYLYRDLNDAQLENKDEYFIKYKNILTKYIDNIDVK